MFQKSGSINFLNLARPLLKFPQIGSHCPLAVAITTNMVTGDTACPHGHATASLIAQHYRDYLGPHIFNFQHEIVDQFYRSQQKSTIMNLSCVQLTFTLVLTSTVAGIRPVINPYSGNNVNTNYNSNNNDEDSSSNNEVHLSTSRYNQELSREWREQQQRLGKNAFAP